MSNLFMDYGLATPHDQLHVPTPAYAPMGNAYIHHFQCQPPNKSLHLLKKLCSIDTVDGRNPINPHGM